MALSPTPAVQRPLLVGWKRRTAWDMRGCCCCCWVLSSLPQPSHSFAPKGGGLVRRVAGGMKMREKETASGPEAETPTCAVRNFYADDGAEWPSVRDQFRNNIPPCTFKAFSLLCFPPALSLLRCYWWCDALDVDGGGSIFSPTANGGYDNNTLRFFFLDFIFTFRYVLLTDISYL